MKRYIEFEFYFNWRLLKQDLKDFWNYKILRKPQPKGKWKWYGGYK